ncbi:hypothetical protein [Fulvivirga lutea]|uniref:Outer membrane protein beta-barrel domain-containing protein n=1 Tax=Fulvivirga lutea TaxID=2810512 RepID=A0A974ZZZ2_9BACT|nr:hypothetical protein [Fulvivirga lutea]QSE95922.1 hypothetical protein JR347_09845 [Fulvivirga lutea]
MKKIYTLLILSTALFYSNKALAQVEKGDSNIGLNAFLSTITGLETDNVNGTLFLTYQKYVTDNISLGLGPLYSWNATSDNFGSTFGMNLFFNYSFLSSTGKTLPYLGLQYSGLISYNESETTDGFGNTDFNYFESRSGSLGGNAGIKFFINEYANLDVNLSYTSIIATSVDSGNGFEEADAEGGILQFTIGLGVIIGKKGS